MTALAAGLAPSSALACSPPAPGRRLARFDQRPCVHAPAPLLPDDADRQIANGPLRGDHQAVVVDVLLADLQGRAVRQSHSLAPRDSSEREGGVCLLEPFVELGANTAGLGEPRRIGMGQDQLADLLGIFLQHGQQEAADGVEKVVTGETDNLAEVFSAVRKADVAFSMLMEMRNKLVEAYREVQQMRV